MGSSACPTMKHDYFSVDSNCSRVHGVSISSSSESRHYRRWRKAALDRHGLQRIFELRPTVKTHAVGLTSQREHTAEVGMVATAQELKDGYKNCHESFILGCARFRFCVRPLPIGQQTMNVAARVSTATCFLLVCEISEHARLLSTDLNSSMRMQVSCQCGFRLTLVFRVIQRSASWHL